MHSIRVSCFAIHIAFDLFRFGPVHRIRLDFRFNVLHGTEFNLLVHGFHSICLFAATAPLSMFTCSVHALPIVESIFYDFRLFVAWIANRQFTENQMRTKHINSSLVQWGISSKRVPAIYQSIESFAWTILCGATFLHAQAFLFF